MYDTNESPAYAAAEDGSSAGAAVEEEATVEEAAALQVEARSNQLTLSYQREVYVFDSVPPERVQAVLLLLGGQELPSEVAGMTMPHNAIHRASNDVLRSANNPRRMASIMRYREKKKNLNFDKKVQYAVRREVACRMKRHKGQFASSKTNSEEVLSPSSSCEPTQSNSQEEPVSSFCQNCGRGKDSTPMMRRGPSGPRSLCNACGLMWANKGTLRNIPQLIPGIQNSPINPAEQSDANDSDIGSNGCMFSGTSNCPESILIGEIDATRNLG